MFVDRDLRKVFASLEDAIAEYDRTKSITAPSHEVLSRVIDPDSILPEDLSEMVQILLLLGMVWFSSGAMPEQEACRSVVIVVGKEGTDRASSFVRPSKIHSTNVGGC